MLQQMGSVRHEVSAPVLLDQLVSWGTALSACAMVAAAMFAFFAWRAQLAFSRAEKERHLDNRAVELFREAVTDLTTGAVASARDRVFKWTTHFASFEPDIVRGERLDERGVNAKIRRDAFVLLWSLHRLAPLTEVVDGALPSQKRVLRFHVDFIIRTLSDFVGQLTVSERRQFRESADVAARAVIDLAGALAMELDEQIDWAVSLSGFSYDVIPDTEQPEVV